MKRSHRWAAVAVCGSLLALLFAYVSNRFSRDQAVADPASNRQRRPAPSEVAVQDPSPQKAPSVQYAPPPRPELAPPAKHDDAIPFPSGLPAAFKPPGFHEAMREVLERCPEEMELLAVDCIEYPCAFWVQPLSGRWRDCEEAFVEVFGVRDARNITRGNITLDDGARLTYATQFVEAPGHEGKERLRDEKGGWNDTGILEQRVFEQATLLLEQFGDPNVNSAQTPE